MEIETTMVDLPGEGRPMPAQFARPRGDGPWPGIVIVMEGGGMTDQVQDVARRLAGEGYLTLAPDFFYRIVEQLPDEQAARNAYIGEHVWDTQLMADMRAALDYLKARNAPKLGCTGFCWGGRATYLAAAYNRDIAAAVPFYGGGVAEAETTLQRPIPPVDLIQYSQAAILAFFGSEDPHIPMSAVRRIQGSLRDRKVTHETHVYPGAGHGFFRDGSPSYHAEAAADAWEKTTNWFSRYLSP